MSLTIGKAAPSFTLPDQEGKMHALKDYKGQWVVLYFYPKDDTPGCTLEAKDFATLSPDFDKAGVVIIGISKDSVRSHNKFKEKYCLPFQLASDTEGKVFDDYNCWKEKSMYGKTFMGIQRDTFLVDKDGKIAQIWRKVSVTGHAAEVLEAAKKLK